MHQMDDITEPILMKPIGYLKSPFKFKNGTPRQATVCSHARGSLMIEKSVFNNPEHSLDGLQDFSHVWLLFIFHKNNNGYTKAKVKPPRLNGRRVGLFSTRSPYRPNNIGLTLAKIEAIKGDTVYVSGIDILDGTPVLDIKPYIAQYDNPANWLVDRVTLDEHINDQSAKSRNRRDDFHLFNNQENASMEREIEEKTVFNEMTENSDKLSMQCCQVNGSMTAEPQEEVNNVQGADNCGAVTESLNNANTDAEMDEILYTNQQVDKTVNDNVAYESRLDDTNQAHSGMSAAPRDVKGDIIHADENKTSVSELPSAANWIHDPPVDTLHVRFTPTADAQLQCFHSNLELESPGNGHAAISTIPSTPCRTTQCNSKVDNSSDTISFDSGLHSEHAESSSVEDHRLDFAGIRGNNSNRHMSSSGKKDNSYKLQYLRSVSEAREAIVNILREDPRSTYRRKHCVDSLYYFALDIIHVTCWFDTDNCSVEIVRVKPATFVEQCQSHY